MNFFIIIFFLLFLHCLVSYECRTHDHILSTILTLSGPLASVELTIRFFLLFLHCLVSHECQTHNHILSTILTLSGLLRVSNSRSYFFNYSYIVWSLTSVELTIIFFLLFLHCLVSHECRTHDYILSTVLTLSGLSRVSNSQSYSFYYSYIVWSLTSVELTMIFFLLFLHCLVS